MDARHHVSSDAYVYVAVWSPKIRGPTTDPKIVGRLVDRAPINYLGPLLSEIVLMNISSKPALCQPQAPFKEPLNYTIY